MSPGRNRRATGQLQTKGEGRFFEQFQLAPIPDSTSICCLNGASGSRIGESSKALPSPFTSQYGIAIPFGT